MHPKPIAGEIPTPNQPPDPSAMAPADEPEPSRGEAAATRQAEGRLERIEQALERMPELVAKIRPGEGKEARASATDPEATVMKMADGGFRPAYNVEYGTACAGLCGTAPSVQKPQKAWILL